MMNNNFKYKYKVATRCFTYNQAPFIEDTLNGFVIQETHHPVVFIIVDDASTDGEQEIIKRWVGENLESNGESLWEKKTYGYLSVAQLKGKCNFTFVFLLLSENHYNIEEKKYEYFSEWYDAAQYLAMCEGDDFWTNKLKLQLQIEQLDKNKDVVLCYSDAVVVNDKSEKIMSNKPKRHEGACLYPLVYQGNFIITASIIYRSIYEKDWWNFKNSIPFPLLMGDYPKWVFLSSKGSFVFINKEMVAYRLLENSASHSSDIEKVIDFTKNYLDVKEYFNERFELNIDNTIFKKDYYLNVIRVAARYDYLTFLKKVREGINKYPCLVFNHRLIIIFLIRSFIGKK